MFFEICSLLLNNSNISYTRYEKDTISHLVEEVGNRSYNDIKGKNIVYGAEN